MCVLNVEAYALNVEVYALNVDAYILDAEVHKFVLKKELITEEIERLRGILQELIANRTK